LAYRIVKEPLKEGPKHHFDFGSAILSAVGLVLIVVGLQTTSIYGWSTATQNVVIGNTVIIPAGSISPFIIFAIIGLLFNVAFYYSLKHREHIGKEPVDTYSYFSQSGFQLWASYTKRSMANTSGNFLLCIRIFPDTQRFQCN
jgi:hypothetical protein